MIDEPRVLAACGRRRRGGQLAGREATVRQRAGVNRLGTRLAAERPQRRQRGAARLGVQLASSAVVKVGDHRPVVGAAMARLERPRRGLGRNDGVARASTAAPSAPPSVRRAPPAGDLMRAPAPARRRGAPAPRAPVTAVAAPALREALHVASLLAMAMAGVLTVLRREAQAREDVAHARGSGRSRDGRPARGPSGRPIPEPAD
jgi:hypothetical protein